MSLYSLTMATTADGSIQEQAERLLKGYYDKVADERPLPDNFPFEYMLESYFWRAVFLTAFTLGVRLGGVDIVEALICGLLPSPILFVLVYLLIPAACYYVHKTYGSRFNKMDCRVLLIIAAFGLGVGSGAYNAKYFLEDKTPSYFMPGLVGLSFQLLGPHLCSSRKQLIAGSVGSALLFGLTIAGMAGVLSLSSLLDICVSAALAAVNLQILIGAILDCWADMTEAHISALVGALYQHLAFSCLLGTYSEAPQQKTRPSIGKAMLN